MVVNDSLSDDAANTVIAPLTDELALGELADDEPGDDPVEDPVDDPHAASVAATTRTRPTRAR
jgi:hypothetical protein